MAAGYLIVAAVGALYTLERDSFRLLSNGGPSGYSNRDQQASNLLAQKCIAREITQHMYHGQMGFICLSLTNPIARITCGGNC